MLADLDDKRPAMVARDDSGVLVANRPISDCIQVKDLSTSERESEECVLLVVERRTK